MAEDVIVNPVNISPEVASCTKPENNKTSMRRELKGLKVFERKKEIKNVPVDDDTGNRLLHWQSLKKIVCENTSCKFCGGDIDLVDETVGIVSEIFLSCRSCKNNKRSFVRRSNNEKMKARKSNK